jgi:peptidoglycan-N-acetylglucosamine deacetylase
MLTSPGEGLLYPNRFYFTIDCDWVPGSQAGLIRLLEFCDRHHVKATIFFAGRFAEAYPELVRDCYARGHQLGTHGWAHGGVEEDEDFRLASYEQQREWIRLATQAVERAAGIRPVIFRAPNLWIGETTLRALHAEGYRYDSSIPARRFDMGFGRVHYLKYFWAPLEPYRPAVYDLTLPGGTTLLEVPPSSCLFPINFAALRTLGLPVFDRMMRWIGRRSRHLVFYCHPSEFVLAKDQCFPRSMSKWNQRGMSPANLALVDHLLTHLLEIGYTPKQMMDAQVDRLDLRPPIVLRARRFQSDRTYREEGQQ